MKQQVAVKERPILFSGGKVCAILEDRGTQTRRVIKPRIKNAFSCYLGKSFWVGEHPGGGWWAVDDPDGPPSWMIEDQHLQKREGFPCPYGKPGDRLWVREAWRIGAWSIDRQAVAIDYKADGYARREWLDVEDDELWERLWIQSSDDAEAAGLPLDETAEGFHWEPGQAPTRWRPSIHMPRWASRILLEITDIRVERLQDIEREDVYAEGIHGPGLVVGEVFMLCTGQPTIESAEAKYILDQFIDLWDSLNAKRGYGWDRNPWVWVIEFRRIDEPTS